MTQPRALVGNASDESQVQKAKQKEQDRRKQEIADLTAVLDTAQGRRVLWRILSECKVFQCVQGPGLKYREGARGIGVFVLEEIEAAKPEALLQMMQEAKPKQKPQPESPTDE